MNIFEYKPLSIFMTSSVLSGLVFLPIIYKLTRNIVSPYGKADETRRVLASIVDISILRNLVFIIPGLNLAAFVFEAYFSIKDRQGMRLGDKFAMTQVVEGKKVPELAKLFQIILAYFDGDGFVDEKIPQKEIAQRESFNSIKRQGLGPPVDFCNVNERVVSA